MSNFKDVLKETQNKINQIPNVLETEINNYGIAKAREKNKYSCIHCSSRDNMHLYSNTNSYYCFGCRASGDVINLVMTKEGITYTEAVKILANKYGVEIPKVKYTREEKEKFKKIQDQEKKKKNNLFKLNMATKEAKDINRKFELSCLADNLDSNAAIEIVNHSNYKANEIHFIDKYISEESQGITNSIISAFSGGNHLLIAPTGSGKTYTSIEILKRFKIKTIFVLPNASNVNQVMIKYNIPGAYDNLSLIDALNEGNLVTCTWDKLAQIKDIDLSEYIILLDEAHQIYTDMYRNKAINEMANIFNNFKGRLDITATPTILDFDIYDFIIEYKQSIQTDYKVKLYDNIDTKTISNIINNSKKFICLMNDKSTLKILQTMTTKKTDIVTSDNKHMSKLYDNIMNNSSMGNFEGMFNTSCMLASFNIEDKDITDIIIIGGKVPIKDIGTIKQYVARPRGLNKVNVHIFNIYKNNESNPVEIKWLINKELSIKNKIADIYNMTIGEEFTTSKIDCEASRIDDYIYYNKKSRTYTPNVIAIRSEIYDQYYKSRAIENFKVLLEEYFTDIEIIKGIQEQQVEIIKADKKAIKEAKEQAKKELEQVKNILVGYSDLVKGYKNYKLYNYMVNNGLDETNILELYRDKEIHNTINSNSLLNQINLYTEYVLDYNYSYDLAWKLANMNGQARKHKFTDRVKNIIHENIKELYPGEIIDTIDNRVYEFIINRFKPGMSYTSDHLQILSDEIVEVFKDKKKYGTPNLTKLLNSIYKISNINTSPGTPLNYNLYKKIPFSPVPKGKKIRIYTIEKFITIEDIKKELQLSSSDKSIEFAIDRKIKKLISEYEANKQIEKDLIKELFNVC